MKPKIIAFFLPQFHEIPENNEWHGKGFTEWTNVKKARPLFKGHQQPRIPLSYYNLLDRKTRKDIGNMAKKYGIYGFCYYHYWFEGRKLLEKPLELFLEDGEPDVNFCFSWANHTWTRTWGKGINRKTEILLKQTYGGKEDWDNHFKYLLQFFKKERYIKVDNKPLLLIYNVKDITEYDQMMGYWDNLAKHEGFDGIFIMETLNSFNDKKISEKTQGVVQFEPLFSMKSKNLPRIERFIMGFKLTFNKYLSSLLHYNFVYNFNFDKLWERALKREYNGKGKVWFGGFPQRDNSPRKGKNGCVIVGATPKKFGKYMKNLKNKSIKFNSEFIFVNAWNERAEGCYLEPDQLNGYKYLEEIKKL